MLTEINQKTRIAADIGIIFLSIGFVVKYYQAKKKLYCYMDIESLLNQIDSTEEVVATQDNRQDNIIKERLTLVLLSGKSKEYLGKNYSVDEIDKVDEKEMNKLYARYEATLGKYTTQLLKEK